jgi:hypothetical protein
MGFRARLAAKPDRFTTPVAFWSRFAGAAYLLGRSAQSLVYVFCAKIRRRKYGDSAQFEGGRPIIAPRKFISLICCMCELFSLNRFVT